MQKFNEQPRLESITVSFHQGGCGVDGAHYRRRPSFQPGLAFPSPRPPDMQQAQEVASTTSFIHATKRECPLIQGPLRVPRPGSTNVELCGRDENTPTRDIAQETSSRSRKVFAELGMPNSVQGRVQ